MTLFKSHMWNLSDRWELVQVGSICFRVVLLLASCTLSWGPHQGCLVPMGTPFCFSWRLACGTEERRERVSSFVRASECRSVLPLHKTILDCVQQQGWGPGNWEIHRLVSLEYGLDWNRVVWCSGLRLIGQIKCEGFSMITHEKYNLPLASESAKFPLWYVLQYSACIPSSTQKTQVLRGHTRRTSSPTH